MVALQLDDELPCVGAFSRTRSGAVSRGAAPSARAARTTSPTGETPNRQWSTASTEKTNVIIPCVSLAIRVVVGRLVPRHFD